MSPPEGQALCSAAWPVIGTQLLSSSHQKSGWLLAESFTLSPAD
jgi:hypothetical protein